FPKELIGDLPQKSADQLYAFAISLTKDRFDAEDLYQETIYLALKNSQKFKQGTNFMAWMKTIMRNSFINGYRRNRRFLNYVNEKINAYFTEKPNSKNLGESSVALGELSAIIDGIDKRFSEPFLLFYQGFAYEEIAETLQLPLGTVKSRIFIARRRIRETYEKLYAVPAMTEN
ncbi:MAG: RNA polymerase sigma factor, partial [Bacteroidota bacterium]